MPKCPLCGDDHEFDFDAARRNRRYDKLEFEDSGPILRQEFPLVRNESGHRKISSWTEGREPPERLQGALFAYAITQAGQPCGVAFGPREHMEIEEDCVLQAEQWRRPVQLKGLSSTEPERSLDNIAKWIREYRGLRDLNVAVVANCTFTLPFDRLRIENPHIEFVWVLRTSGPDAGTWTLHRLGKDEGSNELLYPT